jgi:hypothetical protein
MMTNERRDRLVQLGSTLSPDAQQELIALFEDATCTKAASVLTESFSDMNDGVVEALSEAQTAQDLATAAHDSTYALCDAIQEWQPRPDAVHRPPMEQRVDKKLTNLGAKSTNRAKSPDISKVEMEGI